MNHIMKIKTIHLVYYSATFTTRRIMRAVVEAFDGVEVKEYDITCGTVGDDVTLSGDGDVLIVGVSSYAARCCSTLFNLPTFRT